MTNDRVYSDKRSTDSALQELEECSGSQFDPDAVSALIAELPGRRRHRVVASGA